MVDALRDCELEEEDESTLDAAWAAYLATFGPSEPVAAPDEPDETRWKFKAGPLTYNSTVGDWASRSKDRHTGRSLHPPGSFYQVCAVVPRDVHARPPYNTN